MTCDHGAGAACWRCSDLVPWWREARIRAGLAVAPPNQPPRIVKLLPRPELPAYEFRGELRRAAAWMTLPETVHRARRRAG